MLQLELTDLECIELRHILARYADNLRHEIGHTDNREFKTLLREREQIVSGILGKLEQQAKAA